MVTVGCILNILSRLKQVWNFKVEKQGTGKNTSVKESDFEVEDLGHGVGKDTP